MMLSKINKSNRVIVNAKRLLFVVTAALVFMNVGTSTVSAQKPTPTPEDQIVNGFKITSQIEIGVRGRSITGSEDKFRSDFNYKNGVRVFNSSFRMDSIKGGNRFLDSLQVNSSGWGADPSGNIRVRAEKTGLYTFTSNIRKVSFFSNLNNHALGQHKRNTDHTFGDFDVKFLPSNDKIRAHLGYSFNRSKGPGTYTVRYASDEFEVKNDTWTNTNDVRAGIEGTLLKFNYNLTQGYRRFVDRSRYTWGGTANQGNSPPPNTAALTTFLRDMPTEGETFYSNGGVHRTFAKSFDFTLRGIYSSTTSDARVDERVSARDASNNFVDLDRFDISSRTKRIQFRGDIGVTWRVTDRVRISNSFTTDRFGLDGGMDLLQELARRNALGNPLATTLTRQNFYRVNDFRRLTNLLEADFQFNNRFGVHLGYKYTNRRAEVVGYNRTLTSAPSATNPRILDQEIDNQTHTFIVGFKARPTKHWTIWGDVERGEADNVFTRVANHDFTNFRLRSRLAIKQVSFSASFISKDNTQPSPTDQNVVFGVDSKIRTFSSSFDWTPSSKISLSTGYTYVHQNSVTDIFVIIGLPDNTRPKIRGLSEYYVRDSYAFVDVTLNPINRLSIYGSYRFSKDIGQGNRVSSAIQNLVTSYPMQLQTPEIRVAFKLTKNIDWNIGYQYFNYREKFQTLQDYRTHLPYTSLTIYLGGSDR